MHNFSAVLKSNVPFKVIHLVACSLQNGTCRRKKQGASPTKSTQTRSQEVGLGGSPPTLGCPRSSHLNFCHTCPQKWSVKNKWLLRFFQILRSNNIQITSHCTSFKLIIMENFKTNKRSEENSTPSAPNIMCRPRFVCIPTSPCWHTVKRTVKWIFWKKLCCTSKWKLFLLFKSEAVRCSMLTRDANNLGESGWHVCRNDLCSFSVSFKLFQNKEVIKKKKKKFVVHSNLNHCWQRQWPVIKSHFCYTEFSILDYSFILQLCLSARQALALPSPNPKAVVHIGQLGSTWRHSWLSHLRVLLASGP